MTKLPATFKEAEALEYARELVALFRSNKVEMLGVPVGVFDDNRHFAVEMLKRYAINLNATGTVVGYARDGWDVADTAVRQLIDEYVNRRVELDHYLAAYNGDIINERLHLTGVKGPKKHEQFFRNIAIVVIVHAVVERFGLHVYRGEATGSRMSACAIAASALLMGEGAVREIWRKFGKPNFPHLTTA